MANEPPGPTAGRSADEGASDRLDSWKDVAAYLQRDVSTVQRWEKREGMPVHRHVHEQLGTIYAYRSELDAWVKNRSLRAAAPGQPAAVPAPTPPVEGLQPAEFQGAGEAERFSIFRQIPRAYRVTALAAVLLLVAGATVVWKSPGPIRSLAVLPLESESGDAAQQYLADGMTEALIAQLGKISSLRVVARGSTVKYKGTRAPASRIAQELGVDAVIRGTLRRSEDRLRISVALLDSADRQIWSEPFERELRDVLVLQREVARAIADHVRARLTASEQARLARPDAVNPQAYDLLLQARYLSAGTTDADNQPAIAMLQRAIDLDPGFAAAYAALASAYVVRLAYVQPDETRDLERKAFVAAEKALSLDADVPEAYLARGDLLWTNSHGFAHDRAVQEFRQALNLNPNSDQAHQRLARVYVHVGFFEQAMAHAEIALAINPSNWHALNSRAQSLLWMGKDEEALAILRSIPGPRLPELVDPNIVFALIRLKRWDEASTHLRDALRRNPGDATRSLAGIEALLAAESQPARADDLIESVRQRKAANPSHHAAYFAASALARMRRAQQATEWLREAAATGFPCYALFARDPSLDPIRSDPHFQAFMREMEKASASLRESLFPPTR